MTEPLPIDTIPELEPGIYQACPDCQGEGTWCMTCWGSGLVAHECHLNTEPSGPGLPD